MLTPQQIHKLTFRGSIWSLLLGCALGLAGIWFEDFWANDVSWKLVSTTWLLFVTCLLTAAITKWLVVVKEKTSE